MSPAAATKTWQKAALAACERLVAPSVEGTAERLARAHLVAMSFCGAFVAAAAMLTLAGRTGAGETLAAVSAILACGLGIGLVAASATPVKVTRALVIIAGAVTTGLLIALGGGLSSPLALLAVAFGYEGWRLTRGRAGVRTGVASIVAAIAIAAVGAAIFPAAAAAPAAWLWLAPALYGALALARTSGAKTAEADVREKGDDARLLGGRVLFELAGNGDVVRASDNSETVMGIVPELLLGSGLFERLRVTDRVAYRCAVADAVAGRNPGPLEVSLRLPAAEGGYRAVRLHAMAAAEGRAVELMVEPRDEVDTLKHALTRAQDQAREGEVAKSRFLAAVSHELRTPLNAIIGFSDLLMQEEISGPMGERQREQIGHIREAGYHLLSVVNAILDVTKIESGTYSIATERFDLAPTVELTRSMLCEQAAAKSIAVTARMAPDAQAVEADQRAVQQMLINLVSNAIKFTPEGGKVEIAARRRDGTVLISVSDTGIGIAADDLERLGKPFAQVQNDYTRQFEGTGLGLSLVKGLVELHGGSMSIESAPGMGTCVTIGLPDARIEGDGRDQEDRHEAPRKIA